MAGTMFELAPTPVIPIKGEASGYPVGRIFCVGRNYAAHAAEMGFEVDREAPWYFTKSPTATVQSGAEIAYPPETENFHFEMELVVAIGSPVFRADAEAAQGAIYGYGCGLDMTRRDRQMDQRAKSRPWDIGKDIENGAVFGPLSPAGDMGDIGAQRIHLSVNDEVKQDAHLSDLIWNVTEIICHLSRYYHLRPGDLIMTGTPAGVGPVVAGDVITGGIDGLDLIALTIGPAEG